MLPFQGGQDYRAKLIDQAKESCDAARRLVNIHAALTICVLSLSREGDFPEALLESLQDEELQTLAFDIGKITLEEPEEEGEAYGVSAFCNPLPGRIWPYFIPAALLELSGSGYNALIPAEHSPTGETISVFTTAYADLSNDFIEYQIDTADKIVDTLNPLTESMAAFVDERLGLNYDGLSLWPFAYSVIMARAHSENLTAPADQWFLKHWPAALANEDRLDAMADAMGEMAPETGPARVLH